MGTMCQLVCASDGMCWLRLLMVLVLVLVLGKLREGGQKELFFGGAQFARGGFLAHASVDVGQNVKELSSGDTAPPYTTCAQLRVRACKLIVLWHGHAQSRCREAHKGSFKETGPDQGLSGNDAWAWQCGRLAGTFLVDAYLRKAREGWTCSVNHCFVSTRDSGLMYTSATA
eukprot:1161352-Pelagomonas_calceolata.AAC.20